MPVADRAVELARRVAGSPGEIALFVDFDGTLSPIVSEPANARPLPSSLAALTGLASRCGVVAVVSGRPLAFLAPFFPPNVRLAGLYGLEQRVDGEYRVDPEAEQWRAVVSQAVQQARTELPRDVLVEDKGLSLTVHFRTSPERADLVSNWVEATGQATGLEPRPAKMSMELHPPVHRDKGQIILEWSAGASTVIFAGDDAGDLPAFAALRELTSKGAAAFGIVVASAETPQQVLAAADVAVEGPEELGEWLDQLLTAAS